MYEYDIRGIDGRDQASVLQWLNAGGETGWEAFFVEPVPTGYRIWLKRQRSNVMGGLEATRHATPSGVHTR